MSITTKCAIACQCGHKGRIACIENNQTYSSFRETYRLEGFFGLALTVASEAERPANSLAALNPRCPKCKGHAIDYAKPNESLERQRMTARGVDFMHEWIDRHVTADCRPAGAELVDALAAKCASDAADRGIALAEIEEELGSDVRTMIFEALTNDPNDEFDAFVMGRRH